MIAGMPLVDSGGDPLGDDGLFSFCEPMPSCMSVNPQSFSPSFPFPVGCHSRQDADRRSYPHCPSRLTHPDSHLRDPYFPLVNANQPIAHSRCKVTMLVLNPRILCQVSMPVVDPSVGALNA